MTPSGSSPDERYRALVQRLPYGIALSTPDGIVTEANPAFAEMLGYESADGMVGTRVADFYVDVSQRGAILADLQRDGYCRREALECKRLDGRTLTVRFSAWQVDDPRYEAPCVEATLEDITERVRLEELSCDGVLISTPAGSSAYNLSAHGPIVPLSANLLPLTPISAFRPRRWRGALLPSTADVLFEVLETDKRPTAAVADFTEVRDVVSVAVSEDRTVAVTVLFDPDQGLSERIIAEQFTV